MRPAASAGFRERVARTLLASDLRCAAPGAKSKSEIVLDGLLTFNIVQQPAIDFK